MTEVKFVITGFGPFGGDEENPTRMIATKIKTFIQDEANDAGLETSVLETKVIETCAEDSRFQLDQIYSEIDQDLAEDCVYIVLHLGVNVFGKNFQLEKCAYNNASFRIPDERSYQPTRIKIESSERLERCLKTSLNTPSLSQLMNADFKDREAKTVVSTNPGRFVCNYTYFYSLNTIRCKFAEKDKSSTCSLFGCDTYDYHQRVHCLFLHVPPLEVCGLQDQLGYVVRLLRHTRSWVRESHDRQRNDCLSMAW